MSDPDVIRVATYNVRNLFLCGEGPQKPRKEVRPLLRVIGQLQADLLVLQEVGSADSLDALNVQLPEPFPHQRFSLGNSNRSIGLGVLARHPVQATSHAQTALTGADGELLECYASESAAIDGHTSPLRFQRDLLAVELNAGADHHMAVFATHLKSKTSKPWQLQPSDEIRAAEARGAAGLLAAYAHANPTSAVLLAGDLNDLWHSDALAPLRAVGLQDAVGPSVQVDGRNPSTYWPRRRTRVDHIAHLPGSGVTLRDGYIHASQMARTASDHFAVSVGVHWPGRGLL